MKPRLLVSVMSPFLSAAPLIFLTYFNNMCEEHHVNPFSPFYNGKKTVTLTVPVNGPSDSVQMIKNGLLFITQWDSLTTYPR